MGLQLDGLTGKEEEAGRHLNNSVVLYPEFLLLALPVNPRLQLLQPCEADSHQRLSRELPACSLGLAPPSLVLFSVGSADGRPLRPLSVNWAN